MCDDSHSNTERLEETQHSLQCMEVLGGNQVTRNALSSPGLDIWVESHPVQGDVGGDVHYFSMCGSGRVTRLAIADVSGHSPGMDKTAKWLRDLMRKNINLLDQTKFARAINREFTQRSQSDYFATVLLVTYFAPTDHLVICNAGHPRPIWYTRRTNRWKPLDHETLDAGPSIREAEGTYRLAPISNLPLGIIDPTPYHQFSVKLEKGDVVVMYTDALIEVLNSRDRLLGESGLLGLLEELGPEQPERLVSAILSRIDEWRAHRMPEDDQTLIVLHHNASEAPAMTVNQAFQALTKLIGLRRV